jgi:hypothetical protein
MDGVIGINQQWLSPPIDRSGVEDPPLPAIPLRDPAECQALREERAQQAEYAAKVKQVGFANIWQSDKFVDRSGVEDICNEILSNIFRQPDVVGKSSYPESVYASRHWSRSPSPIRTDEGSGRGRSRSRSRSSRSRSRSRSRDRDRDRGRGRSPLPRVSRAGYTRINDVAQGSSPREAEIESMGSEEAGSRQLCRAGDADRTVRRSPSPIEAIWSCLSLQTPMLRNSSCVSAGGGRRLGCSEWRAVAAAPYGTFAPGAAAAAAGFVAGGGAAAAGGGGAPGAELADLFTKLGVSETSLEKLGDADKAAVHTALSQMLSCLNIGEAKAAEAAGAAGGAAGAAVARLTQGTAGTAVGAASPCAPCVPCAPALAEKLSFAKTRQGELKSIFDDDWFGCVR